MAIVNRTPDSFFDRGRTFALDAAIAAAVSAVENGADLVDIGGVKFAPGEPVPVEEEIDRVVPVIEGLRGSGAVISVDTFHAEVAEASLAAGAHIVNDTTGLRDPRMIDVVATAGAMLVITHSLAVPRTAYPAPHYDDVVVDVVDFLRTRVDRAVSGGVSPERIIVDPGHDLNKNTLHSIELTRRFSEIAELGYPALAAISNKDFIGETLDREKEGRLAGSLAAMVFCITQGARIVRMHDVAAAVDAARMTEALLGFRAPAVLRHNMA
ncbi:MAG: hypothetical protein RI885_2592 [Actinomycetota bacterium]